MYTELTEASLIIGYKIPRKYFEKANLGFNEMRDLHDSSYNHLNMFDIVGHTPTGTGYQKHIVIGYEIIDTTAMEFGEIQLRELKKAIERYTRKLNKFSKNYLEFKVEKPSLYLYTDVVD